MHAMKWMADESLNVLSKSLGFAKMLPRTIRVRRRGFSPTVKRGNHVRHDGKTWIVTRRSNWNLWLYEHVEMQGDTITVRVPKRYL